MSQCTGDCENCKNVPGSTSPVQVYNIKSGLKDVATVLAILALYVGFVAAWTNWDKRKEENKNINKIENVKQQ
ncbi:MAG: hypothetical protein FWE50_01390 [Alphaproteobacteria bacterium]|nr:hypothetical protein [Alphaproteobacteria bacterium]